MYTVCKYIMKFQRNIKQNKPATLPMDENSSGIMCMHYKAEIHSLRRGKAINMIVLATSKSGNLRLLYP